MSYSLFSKFLKFLSKLFPSEVQIVDWYSLDELDIGDLDEMRY
jgi:hypothetical protein